jgi:hypothetical protein
MQASCIMQRRTTLSADEGTLATLQSEADRRGASLASILREAADEKAAALRAARRPSVGYGRSTDGLHAADVTAQPIAEPPH